MKKRTVFAGHISILILFLISCSTVQKNDSVEVQKYSIVGSQQLGNGCKSILDDYCNQLYAPKASGNLIIERNKPIHILQGETQNQLSQVFYKYSLAKIKNKRLLPSDFFSILEKYDYFEKLDDFIRKHPVQRMTLEERLESEHLNYELGSIWQSAIEQTVLSRMSAKYRGFHQIPNRLMPIEYEIEEKRIRRNLISEFSRVLWRDDANWKKVTDGFNDLKASFLILFEELDIPKDVQEDWKEKIKSLVLVLPGSLPEISDEECSTTTINAYYYKYLNVLTVCAGDFNSEDILFTLAHEMSHSLGIDRSQYLYLQKSKLGTTLKNLRTNVCSAKNEISCEAWSNFKNNLPQYISELQDYHSPLIEFNRCLKKIPETKVISDSDFDRIAEKISKSRIANFASTDLFLRLIKNKLPMKNGKLQKNPNYMNPCSYYLWSKNEEPIDDEIYSLIFFAAEYRCNNDTEAQKLKNAIDTSQLLTKAIVLAALKAEGEFSDRTELVSEGFSSPPLERSADVLGTYVVAEYFKRFSKIWERRTKYLASSSWLCQEPSLDTKYPDESKIVQQFNLDSHVQGEDRIMEIFSQPIRESLSCEKDFTFKECHLNFKSK